MDQQTAGPMHLDRGESRGVNDPGGTPFGNSENPMDPTHETFQKITWDLLLVV